MRTHYSDFLLFLSRFIALLCIMFIQENSCLPESTIKALAYYNYWIVAYMFLQDDSRAKPHRPLYSFSDRNILVAIFALSAFALILSISFVGSTF